MAPLSPCGPASSPTRLPPTFPHFSLWLASLPHSPCLSPPFLCLSPLSLAILPPHPPHTPGLFFTLLGPVSWLMPSPVLILNNDQIYQWGEKRCVCVLCLPVRAVGGRGALCRCPVLGDSHEPSLAPCSATKISGGTESWVLGSKELDFPTQSDYGQGKRRQGWDWMVERSRLLWKGALREARPDGGVEN